MSEVFMGMAGENKPRAYISGVDYIHGDNHYVQVNIAAGDSITACLSTGRSINENLAEVAWSFWPYGAYSYGTQCFIEAYPNTVTNLDMGKFMFADINGWPKPCPIIINAKLIKDSEYWKYELTAKNYSSDSVTLCYYSDKERLIITV